MRWSFRNTALAALTAPSLVIIYVVWFFYDQFKEGKEFASWINQAAITLSDRHPFLDESSLKNIGLSLNGSRVIGLGESTHGTSQFDVIKLELLQLLVNRYHCRLLALEASYSRCWLINRKINGKTPIDSLIWLTGFTNLQTLEFRNTLQWIRDYNRSHPSDRVSIVGIDVQGSDAVAGILGGFYKGVDPELGQQMERCIKYINQAQILTKASPLPTLSREFLRLRTLLITKAITSGNFSKQTIDEIEAFQRVIHQYAVSYGEMDFTQASLKRDSCMAVNALIALGTLPLSQTMVVFAHNGHVSKWNKEFRPLGYWLSRKLDSEYFAMGFDFGDGVFRADDPAKRNSPGWEDIESEPTNFMHLSRYFQQAGKPNAFLNLTLVPTNPVVSKWLYSKPLIMHSAGSASQDTFFNDDTNTTLVGKAFDGLIMICCSSPTKSID